jgi:hypothetical protein
LYITFIVTHRPFNQITQLTPSALSSQTQTSSAASKMSHGPPDCCSHQKDTSSNPPLLQNVRNSSSCTLRGRNRPGPPLTACLPDSRLWARCSGGGVILQASNFFVRRQWSRVKRPGGREGGVEGVPHLALLVCRRRVGALGAVRAEVLLGLPNRGALGGLAANCNALGHLVLGQWGGGGGRQTSLFVEPLTVTLSDMTFFLFWVWMNDTRSD